THILNTRILVEYTTTSATMFSLIRWRPLPSPPPSPTAALTRAYSLRKTGGALRRRPPPKRVVFRDELSGYQPLSPNDAGADAAAAAAGANADAEYNNDINNSLLAPVYIPEDPNAVLRSNHPAV